MMITVEAVALALAHAGVFKYPLHHPQTGIPPACYIYGPPNTGKTALLRAFPDAIYYGTMRSHETVGSRYGIQFAQVYDWASDGWAALKDGKGNLIPQGCHKDPKPLPILGFPLLAQRIRHASHRNKTVVLDEFSNWQSSWKAMGINGCFWTEKGTPDGGKEWSTLGSELTALTMSAAANNVHLVVLGHEQEAGVKEFRGTVTPVREAMFGPSHVQNARFATLFGLRVRALTADKRPLLQGDFSKPKAVQTDRTGVLVGNAPYPSNLGAILRVGGYNVSYAPLANGRANLDTAALDAFRDEKIREWLGWLSSPGLTPESIKNHYRAIKAAVREQCPGDHQLQQLVYEDIRDSVEIVIRHFEEEQL